VGCRSKGEGVRVHGSGKTDGLVGIFPVVGTGEFKYIHPLI